MDASRYESDGDDDYYKGNSRIPYLTKGSRAYSHQKVVDIILSGKSKRVCSARPVKVEENATFLIDRSKLSHQDDWAKDDLGTWRNQGYGGTVLTVSEDGVVFEARQLPKRLKDRCVLEENQYLLKTTYYCCQASTDYSRRMTSLTDWNGTTLDLIILSYSFTGAPHAISLKPHGNARKRKSPFVPTATSTKNKVKNSVESVCAGPSRLYDEICQDVGDIWDLKAVSDLPRNTRQVKYARQTCRAPSQTDDVADLLTYASTTEGVVMNLQFTPKIRFLVSPQQTLKDVSRFCTDPQNVSPIVIDKTYKVGNFFVTPTCYKNLVLVNRNDGVTSPWIPGPALFHLEEDESVYRYFGLSLIEQEPTLSDILFIGMDREKAIKNGLQSCMSFATFLFCLKHMRDDVERQMTTLKVSGELRTKILCDVFGDGINTTARIESTSEPMKINCSASFYNNFKEKDYLLPRGKIEMKGKGFELMFFLKKDYFSLTDESLNSIIEQAKTQSSLIDEDFS